MMLKRDIELAPNKNIYFASDFHLGAPDLVTSKRREKQIIAWLAEISKDAQEVFILGDVFDFWYEYTHLAPKGHIRLLGKIAELTDEGIPVHFFHGNHDMWMRNYLPDEIGITIYKDLVQLNINDAKLLVGHGDGLGPGDYAYKFLKKLFRSGMLQWVFSRFHPNFSFRIAHSWSAHSRKSNHRDAVSLGEDEHLLQYCRSIEARTHYDYYVFGHRHLPLEMTVNAQSKYFNLGEWINYCTFGKFDGQAFSLHTFEVK